MKGCILTVTEGGIARTLHNLHDVVEVAVDYDVVTEDYGDCEAAYNDVLEAIGACGELKFLIEARDCLRDELEKHEK